MSEINIEEYIYPKDFECKVCLNKFKSNFIKDRKVRLEGLDYDLFPNYLPVNPIFYEIVVCPICGYAALKNYFDKITKKEIDNYLKNITPSFKNHNYPMEIDVNIATEQYISAYNAVCAKYGKNSEKGYLALRISWLFKVMKNLELQKEYAKIALENFEVAILKEDTPMMGIEFDTVNYIIAAMNTVISDKSKAKKYLSDVIVSPTASKRLKDMARDLKEDLGR
ncbi:MAG: DUF2225 domain-containing protein [Defluviitaleaceae bacterium]|nr:DUF2225 domain-containing protein [Defluviitaleaceae bacterium]